MTGRRVVLSTHVLRRQARKAKGHYERIQDAVVLSQNVRCTQELAHLHLGPTDDVRVERAVYERGKWVVIGEPRGARKASV